MINFKILAIVVLIMALGQSAVLVYFVGKTRGLSQQNQGLEEKIKSLEPVSQKYTTTARELESVKADRENILTQTKNLLADQAELTQVQDALQQKRTEASLAEKELGQVKSQNLSLKEDINKLQAAQAQLIKEGGDLKIAYENAVSDTRLTELKKTNSDLQEDLKSQNDKDKAQEKEISRLNQEKDNLGRQKDKLNADNDQLTAELKDYKKNYAEAVRKNKGMESKIRGTPGKFAEIARQNKVLIRQTSDMHYNLGVFYTKNKDYDRAVAEFEQCVAINPNNANAHFNLGYIYSEYLVNRDRAMDHFRHYLRLAKSDDPDLDWVKKYILTWESYSGKMPMQ